MVTQFPIGGTAREPGTPGRIRCNSGADGTVRIGEGSCLSDLASLGFLTAGSDICYPLMLPWRLILGQFFLDEEDS